MLNLIIITAALAIAIIAAASLVIRTYNRLVADDQFAGNSFSQIEVQLKRRYDLIPSLVESTRAYLVHERDTLEAVIAARQQASSHLADVGTQLNDANVVARWSASESALGGAIGRLAVVIEAYPELKANETIASLTEELSSTENRIAFARQVYNDSATTFNIRRTSFPAVVFADLIGFGDNLAVLSFDDQPQIHHAPQFSLVAANAS